MGKVDKVIVTNNSALTLKYGANARAVLNAVALLVAADAKRGLTTQLVALDHAPTMRKLGGRPVTNATDPKQNKDAVDAVFNSLTPDYLVILGAPDVIPHQDLTNPIADDDKIAWGDLPYACAARYSKNVRDFLGPTRVVGRVPDVTGMSDPSYVQSLLKIAASYSRSSPAVYNPHLGVSAEVWKQSTGLSLANTFGSATGLQSVPPQAATWPPPLLGTRSHFFNCHGGPGDPHFYGQRANAYPIAHDAAYLVGRVTTGTVIAAECCYGAELYNPTVAAGQMGICNTYLAQGAYGFFGSSTTAYGPSSGNSSADLICQYFMQRVLAGSSLGRATLEARQHFVQTMSVMDPSDLKTLAQFSLMGDPAIHPVEPAAPALTHTAVYKKVLPEGSGARGLRRENLTRFGSMLGRTTGAARQDPELRPKPNVREALKAAAHETGLEELAFASYTVEIPTAKGVRAGSRRTFHVAMGKHPDHGRPVKRNVLFILEQVDGEIVALRRLHAR